ncbi:hypothetical protein B0T16DRAFT_421129 [Cercophora newfieldiana]|uniref:Uncharacterized protein n=1 Tax=Cercophora newfieldiana TaxID=92897 RepID=A0AA40CKW8_9PEZI|nr:hypothetical protein B0T16DRAFT_421129 [Cercophora newfieldiana]
MGHANSKPTTPLEIPAELTTQGAFPHRLKATYQKSLSKIIALLSDPDDPYGPSYTLSWGSGWKDYGDLTVHSGPTSEFPPLALARTTGKLGSEFHVTLPALLPYRPEQHVEMARYVPSLKHETWWFATRIGQRDGDPGRVERFEWRRSRGTEVKGVEGGSGSGWKLVRMGSDNERSVGSRASKEGSGGEGGTVDGYTSDGKEVVAVWADAGGLTLSRVGAFEFRGSGATGELGLLWSVMAVVTCMSIWHLILQRNLAVM